MYQRKKTFVLGLLTALSIVVLSEKSSLGYVDLAPTLAKIIGDSKRISVVEVVEFDRAQHTVVLKETAALKGELASEPIRQLVASSAGGTVPVQIAQWAEPRARAVAFISRNTILVCVGHGWYPVRLSDAGVWKLGADRPDLPLAYYGSTSRLIDGIQKMIAEQDTELTAVSYGSDDVDTSIDLALNRTNLPGLVKVERFRANLKMPAMVMAASANAAYLLGQGAAEASDMPALVERLKSSDATARAEAATDLGWLGKKAAAAAGPLSALLDDKSARVRFAAAAALLRVSPSGSNGIDVLATGLSSAEPAERRDAAQAIGYAGPRAAVLTSKLAALLADSDHAVRVAALQAIATLGAGAAKAAESIVPLLDDPEYAIIAADALGRIGPAARPMPKQLAKMLASDQPSVRWAAVRAMSQIGGADAHPAVELMIQELPKAAEIEAYNMLVYLALLGTDAKDAVPAVRTLNVRLNPMLRPATLWAIDPESNFPWQNGGGRFGMPGGGPGGGPGGPGGRGPGGGRPGGGGPGGGAGPDLARYIYTAYFHELGDRLSPMVKKLSTQIIDGSAGEIPQWGYELLNCAPDDALTTLLPNLAGDDSTKRERAAVAIGFMGPTAARAKSQLDAAIAKTSDEQEKRLLQWCAREISAD